MAITQPPIFPPALQRRFDEFFYEDHHEYGYENHGGHHYHDHPDEYYYPRRDPYHRDLDLSFTSSTLYRDVSYYPRPRVIRNPRDHRNFPGNQPAGVLGVNRRLLKFIRERVNEVAFVVQGP